ncbi:MAG: TolC family protein [Bacteroidota bacterium]
MKKAIIFLVTTLLFAPLLSRAQVLPFDSIKAIIEKQHPELAMYDLRIKAYNAYAAGAKSWEAPQIGTGLYMTPYSFEKNMGAYMISAQQMITNPAKLKASYNYMQGMASVEVQNKSAAKNELFAQAKMAYTEWLILKRKKAVLTESEDLMSYIIKVSEIRYPLEQEKLGNIYKAKAGLAEVQSMELMADNDITQQQIKLNTLMNRDRNITFDIDTTYIIHDYEMTLIDTATIAKTRSDLRAIDQEINVLTLKQRAEWSKRMPDFGIRYDNMFGFGSQPTQFTIMGMITIPIAPWSSKMYKANIAGINFEIASSQKEKEALLNDVSGMIQSLQAQIKSKKKQVDLYEKNIIPALEKNYKVTMLAYEQNTEDLFMVLDAWQALKMAKLEYLDQLKELLLQQAEFEKLMENYEK